MIDGFVVAYEVLAMCTLPKSNEMLPHREREVFQLEEEHEAEQSYEGSQVLENLLDGLLESPWGSDPFHLRSFLAQQDRRLHHLELQFFHRSVHFAMQKSI